MGTTRSGFSAAGHALACVLTLALSIAVLSIAALSIAAPAASARAARARPATVLYDETVTSAGTLSIERVSLQGPRLRTAVVGVGNVSVFGIAVAGPYVYWSTEAGPHDRGAIMRANLDGTGVRRMVSGLTDAASVIVVHGYVYWVDQKAIGRMALDGSHRRRRFIVLPQEHGGGVADGLASDGRHLYISRCQDDVIERADLSGAHRVAALIATGPHTCPQGLAVGGAHLYWTQLGSGTIGRARLNGRGADDRWLRIHSDQGPFQIAADSGHVYWTWGGINGTPNYLGRASASGHRIDRRFLIDSLYPIALT